MSILYIMPHVHRLFTRNCSVFKSTGCKIWEPRVTRIQLVSDKTALFDPSPRNTSKILKFKTLNPNSLICKKQPVDRMNEHLLLWVRQQTLKLSKFLPVTELPPPPPSISRHIQFMQRHELLHRVWSIVTSSVEDNKPFRRLALPNRLTTNKDMPHSLFADQSPEALLNADFWGNKGKLQNHQFTVLNGLILAF